MRDAIILAMGLHILPHILLSIGGEIVNVALTLIFEQTVVSPLSLRSTADGVRPRHQLVDGAKLRASERASGQGRVRTASERARRPSALESKARLSTRFTDGRSS